MNPGRSCVATGPGVSRVTGRGRSRCRDCLLTRHSTSLAPSARPRYSALSSAGGPRGALAGNCIDESLRRRVVCLKRILEHERICGAELQDAVFEEHLASARHGRPQYESGEVLALKTRGCFDLLECVRRDTHVDARLCRGHGASVHPLYVRRIGRSTRCMLFKRVPSGWRAWSYTDCGRGRQIA